MTSLKSETGNQILPNQLNFRVKYPIAWKIICCPVSPENQADIIKSFISTSRYIDNIYFEQIVNQIYLAELQLNKSNSSDTEGPFLDLNLSISNGTVSTKIYDKRDDFDFDIVNFPFLDGDVPLCTSYGIYISQLIRFARASSNVSGFSCRNKALTAKLLKQGYRYHKLRRAFSKFYRRHSELVEKYNVSLRKLLQQGISEPDFYGDLVYRIRKIVGKSNFLEEFRKLIKRYKRIGYNPFVMRQTVCLVINPTSVDSYASLFNCMTAGQASRLDDGLDIKLSQVGWGLMLCFWPSPPWFNWWLPLTLAFSGGLAKSTLSLFRHSDRFDFVFLLRCIDWVRKTLGELNFLCIFCIKNYIGIQGEVCTVKGL